MAGRGLRLAGLVDDLLGAVSLTGHTRLLVRAQSSGSVYPSDWTGLRGVGHHPRNHLRSFAVRPNGITTEQ